MPERPKSPDKRNRPKFVSVFEEISPDDLEREAREYIVRHGKFKSIVKKERGIEMPNLSLEEAKQHVLDSRRRVAEDHARIAKLKKDAREVDRRDRDAERKFMARPDESFTLEEYEEAKKIGFHGGLSENDNSPNNYSDAPYAQNAREYFRIEKALKKRGVIPATEDELLSYELDDLYPNAASKSIVEYKGKKYQMQYYPVSKSLTGKTVYAWRHYWQRVSEA